MSRQRPVPRPDVGAVVSLALLAATVSGCGTGTVEVDSPPLDGADARACERLVDALPDAVSDQPRRPVRTEGGYGGAWGDPAIVLRCGVPMPDAFDEAAACQVTNDVGWFVPESQIEDQQADVVMTTIGRAQNVEVRLPARYRPPAAAMVDLAGAVKRTIREVQPCL
jgi:hypothetical protein